MKIGFFGLLTLMLICLKLMGYISISWWWVLSPIPLAFLFFFVVGVILAMIVGSANP